MPDPTPEETAAQAAAEAAAAEQAATDAAAAAQAAKDAEDKLGDAGKAAIAAERKRAKDAEKALKAAQDRLDAIEAEKLSDTEKAEKRATDAEAKVTAATDKLRKANLMAALADEGLTGARAKAAARLLDGVEYGDDDEPNNLPDALKTATAEYGDDMFKGLKPKAPRLNGGDSAVEDGDKPNLTAEELAAAKSFDMTPEEYQAFKDPQPVIPEPKK